MNILIFVIVITTIGIFLSSSYSQWEIRAQTPGIAFETTNASVQSFNDHNFIVDINNLNKNKKLCISGDCSLEIIKLHDSGHPTGGVSVPTPDIQSMYSGVDFRIHDTIYNNMSGLEREYQERWRIWANCDIEEIKNKVATAVSSCGKYPYYKITVLNDFKGIEIPLSLVSGTYDPKLDVINFTANVVK